MCQNKDSNEGLQGNMTPPEEHNNFLVTDSKDMEICNLCDKEFKIIILR